MPVKVKSYIRDMLNSWELHDFKEQEREAGYKLGFDDGKAEVAANMLRRGMSAEEINSFTGLSLERIQELKKNLN
jgi:hypothetical protein